MAKIIHFPKSQATTATDFMAESYDVVKENEVESIIVCCKCKNGEVMTGYFNADFGTKQEMLGHIQADVIDEMILANLDRYNM